MKKYLIFSILFSTLCFSQETLTLEQAIEYGLNNNHNIKIVKNDASIIKNINHIGATGILPNISITSGYNGAINNAELEFNSFLDFGGDMDSNIDASQAKSANLSSSITLRHRLFNGFNGMYTLHKFKKQNEIADENIRYQIETEILNIIQQYYDVCNRENIYNTFKKTYKISNERYQQALDKKSYGAISTLSLLNAETNLNQDKINMEEALIGLKEAKLNLSLLIDVPDSIINIEHEFIFNNSLDIDDLIKKTLDNNASIVIAHLNYGIATDELKIAKANFTPTIDLFSSYSYNNRKSETSFISQQKDYGVIAGINIEIPVFSANMKRKNYQNAKINLDSKAASLAYMKKTIRTTLLKAYYNYTSSLKNLELLRKNLETLEKTAQMNRELYDMGQITNLEYRESQILLDQAEINYSSKLALTKIQEYIIYQLSGQLHTK